MPVSCPVASFARDPGVFERLARKLAVGPRHRSPHPAGMAIQAARIRRQIHRTLARLGISRSHIPLAFLRIPINRSLKQRSVHRKKISPPLHSRPDEIQKLPLPPKPPLSSPLVAHPNRGGRGVSGGW